MHYTWFLINKKNCLETERNIMNGNIGARYHGYVEVMPSLYVKNIYRVSLMYLLRQCVAGEVPQL